MELCIGAKVLSSAEANEAALVERCRRQDMEAFGKIVDAYQNRVFGFVRRMVGDPDESADIAQEVFIRAFQSFRRFDGRSSLRTWLFRIAYNLCVDRARRAGRTATEIRLDARIEDDEPLEISDTRWSPEGLALDAELAQAVEEAVASMSEKLRSVLLLHDREDMQYEEIAQALDLPIGTVKSRLFLARAHLQKALRPYLHPEVTFDA
ncbi:MAG TPA: sigma-70 family RNA polymerase sigma factor [Fimbriimonadaceae bacterium]|nr:sigma-70 family RNA polymerase sigma factor [Fimbriimonadaceae bacterium]